MFCWIKCKYMLYIGERESVAIVLIGHLRASNNQEVTTNECRKH